MNRIYISVKRLFSDSRNSLLWMTLASVIVGGLMVSIYPSIKEAGAEMVEYAEAFPEGFMEAFGITSFDMTQFEAYISTEYFGFFWAMVFLPFIIAWATQFAKSAENGTMGLQLSYPISRSQITISYLIDMVIKSFIAGFIMVWTVVLLTFLIDVDIDYSNWILFTILISILFSAISALGVFFSTLLRNRSAVIGIMAVLVIGSYFINVISRLYDEVENIKYISIFHYYGDPYTILMKGEIADYALFVFIGIFTISSVAAILLSRRMELPKG